jgi:hypothetical protein
MWCLCVQKKGLDAAMKCSDYDEFFQSGHGMNLSETL